MSGGVSAATPPWHATLHNCLPYHPPLWRDMACAYWFTDATLLQLLRTNFPAPHLTVQTTLPHLPAYSYHA